MSQSNKKAVVLWNSSNPACKVLYSNGKSRERIDTGTLIIDLYSPKLLDKRTISVMVGVVDTASGELDVNPATWSAVANDEGSTLLPFIDGDQLLSKEERRARRMQALGNGLAGFGAGMQTQTATMSNSDGTTSTVAYHDPSAVTNVNAAAAQRGRDTTDYFARASDSLLRRNTLENGGFVVGWVYFSRPKGLKKEALVRFVDVTVNGTTYRFPFDVFDSVTP